VACVDTVTYRIVTESGARVAGLETGELLAVEDVPTKAQAELKKNKNVTLLPLENWWVHIMLPNTSFPPTDNLAFRKAVQAALDMDEIMDASTDGAYKLNVGFQYPGRTSYTDAGKETYNLKNKDLAKKYLQEAGYKGEPLILLTNKDYTSMYNAALVVSEQLKAVGINAKLDVVDWPTSVNRQLNEKTGWNFFYTGYGTQPALGALATMKFFVPPQNVYYPKDGASDPDLPGGLRRDAEPARSGGPAGGLRADAEDHPRARLRRTVRLAHQGPGDARQRQGLQAVPHSAVFECLDRWLGDRREEWSVG